MDDVENISDEELVEQVRSQDQELYRELVRRYQEKLIRYAEYFVKDKDRAKDVVQEALIKAFINLQGFNTKKKFSSWIYRIVHNEAINQLKKDKREVSLEKNIWVKEKLSDGSNLEDNFAKKEVTEMLHKSLGQLPVNYRAPLTLFFLEEKSYEEIGDILRMPLGTVATRINRGKKVLKVIYQKNGGEK